MPARKRKPIGQKHPKAKKMKEKRRHETMEERNRRLTDIRKRVAALRAGETEQQRKARQQSNRDRIRIFRAGKRYEERKAQLREMREQATASTSLETEQQQDIQISSDGHSGSITKQKMGKKMEHKSEKKMQKSFSCLKCGKIFKRESIFNSHLRTHIHERLFSCEVCKVYFVVKSSLEEHNMRVHSLVKAVTSDVSCIGDDNSEFEKTNLKNSELESTNLKNREQNMKKIEVFPCEECGQTFKTENNLKKHLITHTQIKLFPCEKCKLCFVYKSYLAKHNMQFHPEDVASLSNSNNSQVNDNSVNQSPNLKASEQNEKRAEVFICCECGITFKIKEQLEEHLKTHTQLMSFSCSDCGNRLHYSRMLFSCKKCKISFRIERTNSDDQKQSIKTVVQQKEISPVDNFSMENYIGYDRSLKMEEHYVDTVTVKEENLDFESEYETIQSSLSSSDDLVQSETENIENNDDKCVIFTADNLLNCNDTSNKKYKGNDESKCFTSFNNHFEEQKLVNSEVIHSVLPILKTEEQETDHIGLTNENRGDCKQEILSPSVTIWTGLV